MGKLQRDEVMSYAIGVDLGGSSIKAVAVTHAGLTLNRENIPFEADEQMDWAQKIRECIDRIQKSAGSTAGSVGLSAPGLASSEDARSPICRDASMALRVWSGPIT